MKAFVITSLALSSLGLLVRFLALAWSDYPRVVKYSRGDDVFMTLVTISWAGWALWLLIH